MICYAKAIVEFNNVSAGSQAYRGASRSTSGPMSTVDEWSDFHLSA
jgi:hypothetical protein